MVQPRTYRSTARAESARQTRRRIVEAARELFETRGYAGTTIDAVAEAAGVSRRTVFLSVGSKAELLKTAWDWGVVGDDEPVPMAQRPHVLAMQEVTDPDLLVALWVDQILGVADRLAPLEVVLNRAVDADADAAALRARIDVERRGGALMFVTHLAATGGLREGDLRRRGGRHVLDPDEPAAPGPPPHRPRLDPRGGRRLAGPAGVRLAPRRACGRVLG